MISKTRKGDIAISYVISTLLEKGYKVLKPISEDSKYDLVVDTERGFKRIQVKSIYTSKSSRSHILDMRHSSYNGRQKFTYNQNEIDIIIGFVPETKDLYIVPYKEPKANQLSIWVVRPPKYKNCNPNLKYKNNFLVL